MQTEQHEESALLQSIEVAKALKQQNVALKAAFDELKTEYISIQQELFSLKKAYQNEIEAKKSLEFDCQNLYKKWNDELKIQAQEFEKIQSEMISNTELELLKVKIIEELETSYTEKLNWMNQEMDKYHNLYTKTVRELEILKIDHKNAQISFENALNEQKTTFEFKILSLEQQNEELKIENSKENNILLKQEIQQYKAKQIEYNQQIQCLRNQINSLNENNSKLCIQIEELKCENITKIKEIEGKLLIKETECNGLNEKYDELYKEYEIDRAHYLNKENELQKLETNQNYLNNLIENKKEEILNLNNSFCKKEKLMKEKYDKEINILNDKIINMENEINEIYTKKENLKIEINKLNNKHLNEIQQIKQENFRNFNDLIESKQELEKQYEEIKCKLIRIQNENDKSMDSLTKNLDRKTIHLKQMEKEKENLSEINKKLEKDTENLLNEIKCLKQENCEINFEYKSLTNKHRNILDTNYALTNKENKYLTQIEFLENDINAINKKIDEKVKDLTVKHENKMKEINDENEKNIKSLNKFKKEKAKYKKLATVTKLKVNGLSKEILNIKRNYETELKTKTFEITNLNKQIRKIEREKDEIKFRLTMDSTTQNIQISNNNNDTDLITNHVEVLLKELEMEQNKTIKDNYQPNAENIDS